MGVFKPFTTGKFADTAIVAGGNGLHILGTRFVWGALSALAITYFLFQKKLLPLEVSKVVSKVFFLPTFPITALMRLGNYWTKIDDTLILGCAPMGFLGHPDELYKLGVRGVVNMCYEYPGPKASYARLGMKQLYLPTVDHTEPRVEQMKEAVAFIKFHKDKGEKVYVHCKAGHGRAASIALCWMMHENRKTPDKVSCPHFIAKILVYTFHFISCLSFFGRT
jgi:atypical dual specificity phosphatase